MENFIFDGVNKIIQGDYTTSGGVFSGDVKDELYSAWKRWVATDDNSKYEQAMSTTGGDPISDTISVGAYYFLENGWKIRPLEEDHRLVLNGNLYTRDDSSPYLAVASYSILTETRNSSLTQSIVSGSGVTNQDKTDIAGLVWDELVSNHTTAGTTGKELSDAKKAARLSASLSA
jgi:hypothetical protein